MLTSLMLAPAANATYVTTSGQAYLSNGYGVINNIQTTQDQTDLVAAGCAILSPPPTDLLFYLRAANFNVTTDQILTPTFNGKFRAKRIVVINTSVNGMSTAAGGVYTAASKGGSAIVSTGQIYTGLTNALTALELTLALPNLAFVAGTPLYFALTTAQGAAASADIYVYGDVYV
jgi:hypothetical protein